MNPEWPIQKLSSIAGVRVSNVDKKTSQRETRIRLCNYMDVYCNDRITNEIDFMEATATSAEIQNFGLELGDVIITKDSETPDDIGIPATVTEEIENLVCGYHLAMIRPRSGLNPEFLAQQLSTSRVARYFALKASGSTRYGLPIGAIESVEIPTPPLPEQTKIAEILSTVDRAIEQTEALITKQQRLKTGLMQDLLTRGIDEHGNLRSEQTHKFKDSPLGRIPEEWEVTTIQAVGKVVTGNTPTETSFDDERQAIPFVTPGDIDDSGMIKETVRSFGRYSAPNVRFIPSRSICVVCIGSTIGKIGMTSSLAASNQQINCVIPINHCVADLLLHSMQLQLPAQLRKEAGLQAVPIVNKSTFEKLLIAMPQSEPEAVEIQKRLLAPSRMNSDTTQSLLKLRALKRAVMKDLLSGKKRVTDMIN